MSDKPKRKRSEEKIYRPTLLRQAGGVVGLIIAPIFYAMWLSIFFSFRIFNNDGANLALFLLLVAAVLLHLYLVFATTFGIRLYLSAEGGEYHFLRHHIYFRWEDVKSVEYMRWGNKRDWYLVLDKTAVVDKPRWSPLVNLIYKSLETHIPLGEFIPVTAVKLHSVDFWGARLGNEIRQYAPNLYTPYWLNEMQKSKR